MRIVLDGVESKPYTGVKFKSLVFSPDSQRLAFIAKESDLNGERVVVDGVLSPDCEEYNYVLSLVFSPDSRRVAYYAKLAVDRSSSVCPIRPFELGAFDYLVVDGVEKRMRWSVQGTNMWDLNRGIFFTPDSKQVVYMTQLSMVTDGEERALEPPPDLHSLPVWNADWSRLAYVSYGTDAQGKSVQSLVVDGLKGKDYATVSGTEFTPDGKHFAYLVTDAENKKSFVVVDGVEGERYDSVMLNSTFMPTIEERIRLFDSSERLHYVAWRDRSLYLVEETLK